MSSSGRYQSRLFNFFYRQSQRFGDGVGRTLRQVKISAKWSLKALVFPVFVLVQRAIDSAGQQLGAGGATSQPQLGEGNGDQPPHTDVAIVRVLDAVRDLNTSPNVSDNTKALVRNSHHQTVQAIAINLDNHNLVLVGTGNEILDVLTPLQQQRLQDKIISEVAEYWRLWQLAMDKKASQGVQILPEIDRLLLKLTGGKRGVVTDDVSDIVDDVNEDRGNSLALVDAAVAALESNALVPISRAAITVRQGGLQMIRSFTTQLNTFVYGGEVVGSGHEDRLNNQHLGIKELIWQGINYFFGNSSNKNIELGVSEKRLISGRRLPSLPPRQYRSENVKDPWLTFDDLFGDDVKVENQELQQQQVLPLSPQRVKLAGTKLNPRRLQQYQQGGELATSKKTSSTLAENIRVSPVSPLSVESAEETTYQFDEKKDFIEINARTVGYEKHPLELILEWLDSLLMWLEEILIEVISFVRKLWQMKR